MAGRRAAVFCAGIAPAALAFLRFNFPPARVVMWDAGSIPLLVFSPLIVDACVTLTRRALRAEKIGQAHRSHCYQRVVLLGVSHRQLAVAAYALMLAMVALAFALRSFPQQVTWVFILPAMTYLMMFHAIEFRWHRSRNEP